MPTSRANRRTGRRGFTLIELMVVAAIIAVLLTITVPAIKALMESSQSAQADNVLRAALYSARAYAIQQRVISGIRCQDDGTIVQIYNRDSLMIARDDYITPPLYNMKAVEKREPLQMPDNYRVTFSDVGNCNSASGSSGDLVRVWLGPPEGGSTSGGADPNKWPAAKEWLSNEQTWFLLPVVLFSTSGRVILGECKFEPGWYNGLDRGSFAKATSGYTNNNRATVPVYGDPAGPSRRFDEPTRYTNQVAVVGWRSGCYKTTLLNNPSHDVPVESPSVTAAPRIFNYKEFKTVFASDKKLAMANLISTASDCLLDPNTGVPVRKRQYQKTGNN